MNVRHRRFCIPPLVLFLHSLMSSLPFPFLRPLFHPSVYSHVSQLQFLLLVNFHWPCLLKPRASQTLLSLGFLVFFLLPFFLHHIDQLCPLVFWVIFANLLLS
ncbi:hypothetical protein AMTRI_Chr03g48780 [Amborella trichopoda]